MHKHSLLNLLKANKGKGQFRADISGDEATIYLYDALVPTQAEADWCGGIAADQFVQTLNSLKAATVHLRMNCPGGDVFAARAMEQAIREYPGQVVCHIDGYAASAATFVACACDEVLMAPGSLYMVHCCWTIAMGNAEDLISTAALLEKIDGTMVASYVAKTGADAAVIDAWMEAETWFTAQEAVDAGFVDAIDEVSPKAQASWDLSVYDRAPKPSKEEQENISAKVVAEPEAPEEPVEPDTEGLKRLLRLKN